MPENPAPVALFCYNRPSHLSLTLESLKKNNVPHIYAFSDGPGNESEIEPVKEVREILRSINWTRIIIIEKEKNEGLATSIETGISDVLDKHPAVIVVEDDLILSPGFYQYMIDALETYKNEEKVMHISGYMLPISKKLPETFFYNVNSCWGWATWKRAWRYYQNDIHFLYDEIKKLGPEEMQRFNGGQGMAFFNQLKANKEGTLNTWAIKWHTSIFLNQGLCLHPGKSLVKNTGNDGSGTHSRTSGKYHIKDLANRVSVEKIPLQQHPEIVNYVNKYWKRHEALAQLKKIPSKSLQKVRSFWKGL